MIKKSKKPERKRINTKCKIMKKDNSTSKKYAWNEEEKLNRQFYDHN